MKMLLAAVLNGALVLATCAGFITLNAAPLDHDWAVATYLPSIVLAAGAAFIFIGGLDAIQAHLARDVALCAALAVVWTAAQVAVAMLLLAILLPPNWLNLDSAKTWMLAGTAAQAILLAILTRVASRIQGRDLELK